MRSQPYSTFTRHKRTLAALLFGVAFSAVVAYATPPTSPYTAGETLDPTCAPGDVNCTVDIGGSSLIGSTSTLSSETWLGVSAGGSNASSAATVFIGENAGDSATNASNATFIGASAGASATNANASTFIGPFAGASATNASNATFIGSNSGTLATNASGSTFIGPQSGYLASNAANSIFIGKAAGNEDLVNNTISGSSILIGNGSSTGGFSNSIALGTGATNTASNQFLVDDLYTQFNIRGVNYTFPSSQGGVGTVLTNNGSGELSWATALSGTTSAFGSTWLGNAAGSGGASTINTVFIGGNAGYTATNAASSVFIGLTSGYNATDAAASVFVGNQAGQEAVLASESIFIGAGSGYQSATATGSIFIGNGAGLSDIVDNTGSVDDYSILIGESTSTGGFSNSIALGYLATNTSSNQFMIGSTTRPIDSTRINGSAATQCTITTGTGISCTSDERLKTNIETLEDDTLEKIRNVDTVTFNWLGNPTGQTQVGFLAQNLEDSFPELVATDTDGYKSVYYAQMTPILVKAIQELDVKVDALAGIDDGATFMDSIAAWLANAGNRITRIFTGEICLTDESGDSECLNKEELGKLKQLLDEVEGASGTPAESPVEETVIETEGGITI